MRDHNKFYDVLIGKYNNIKTKKVTKGTRWMPRLLEAKKDVVSCEKLRGEAKHSLIRKYPNGATYTIEDSIS